ncbi:uncharacterized protein LOC132054244 [Lycium ferocissimum]|uniref:uncharacterized protein LOC132054244 n=1 Tax=Lycium ferocissimum TaxID=112874 RepID=UPI0028165644|nr:uncharacterized protein LOC132054244 [Lycium ferocissimum]
MGQMGQNGQKCNNDQAGHYNIRPKEKNGNQGGQKDSPIVAEDENVFADLIDREDYSSAIVHPWVRATSVKIDSSLYQLLKLQGYFWNSTDNDPHQHLQNSVDVCAHHIQNNISEDAIHLRLFKYSLAGDARVWFEKLPQNSIPSWAEVISQEVGSNYMKLGRDLKNIVEVFKSCFSREYIDGEILYRAASYKTQSVAYNAAGGCFMDKTYTRISNMLDRLTTHNQAWHSGNADSLLHGDIMIHIMVKENHETKQTLAQLAINISLLTKRFDEKETKKIEDANYVNNSQGGYQRQNYQGGYQNQNQWRPKQGQGTYNNDQGNYNNNYGGSNQGNYDNTIILKIRVPIHIFHQRGNQMSKKLESQMRDISRDQDPPQKGGLPSDTIPNPKNGGGAKKKVIDLKPVVEEEEVQSDAPIIAEELFKSKPPFPQRLVKKTEDAKFQIFYDQLKQLSLNFPFLDAVKEMPGFSKYLKDLLTKKRSVQHETVSLTHTVSSIILTTTVQKKGDPGAFTISCSIGRHDFARALCDNGASINQMPLAIYKQSGLGMLRPMTMRLQMADRSIKRPVGVVDDVLVRVDDFLLLADFVILDCVIDRDILIILGRPFLTIGRALMDLEKNEIKF